MKKLINGLTVNQDRATISVKKELWKDFSNACKLAGVGKSFYLQLCMKAFVDMDNKPITEIMEESMISLIKNDSDLVKDLKKIVDVK